MYIKSVVLVAISFLFFDAVNAGCTQHKTIKKGNTCYGIEVAYKLSNNQFLALNPGIKCSNLKVGSRVCVAGHIGSPTSTHKATTTTAKTTSKTTTTSTTIPKPTNVCHSYTDDFKSKSRIVSDWKYSGNPKSADWIDISGNTKTWTLGPNGLEMRVLSPGKVTTTGHHNNKVGQGATFNSTYELNYGYVEAKIKMSPVPGIVTAFITMSDRGDEVDWEWVGGSDTHAQSNYYYDGIADYTNGKVHLIAPAGNPNGPAVNNSVDWSIFRLELQPDYLQWSINGNIVRTQFRNQTAEGKPPVYHFPSQKTRVQLGIWDSSSDDGTAEWANGPVHWNSLGSYVSAYVEYVKIECDPRYNKVVT